LLANEPEDVQAEVLRINKHARDRSLQVALIVPVLASLLGLLNAFRMRRLPDPIAASTEGVALG
jgi:ABC-type spermidine/putrescine transport system permease subunit II